MAHQSKLRDAIWSAARVGVGSSTVDCLSVFAAAILSASFIGVIRILSVIDMQSSSVNMAALRVFVMLESIAVFISVGVLTVNCFIDCMQISIKVERAMRQFVLLSMACSIAGAFFAWTFLSSQMRAGLNIEKIFL